MKKTLLILGASGLTGYKTLQISKRKFETFGTYNLRAAPDKSLFEVDVSNEDSLRKAILNIKPDVVLNTTALHNVDYCETHPDDAFQINKKSVGIMASLCNIVGARFVHISTDFVFGGEKRNYTERDIPNPLSVYAKSKLEGEIEAKRCTSYSVLRTSVVYGWNPLETQHSPSSSGKSVNFALWVLSNLSKKEKIEIVYDQYSSPTLADMLAAVAVRIARTEKNELYHVSGTSELSRFDFTRRLAMMFGYCTDLVKPIRSISFKQVAKRPFNSSLNCTKVQKDLNYRLLNVDESLAVMRSQIEIESPSLLAS